MLLESLLPHGLLMAVNHNNCKYATQSLSFDLLPVRASLGPFWGQLMRHNGTPDMIKHVFREIIHPCHVLACCSICHWLYGSADNAHLVWLKTVFQREGRKGSTKIYTYSLVKF